MQFSTGEAAHRRSQPAPEVVPPEPRLSWAAMRVNQAEDLMNSHTLARRSRVAERIVVVLIQGAGIYIASFQEK